MRAVGLPELLAAQGAVEYGVARIEQETAEENQEEHHRTKSFTEEINEFMKIYGWEIIKE